MCFHLSGALTPCAISEDHLPPSVGKSHSALASTGAVRAIAASAPAPPPTGARTGATGRGRGHPPFGRLRCLRSRAPRRKRAAPTEAGGAPRPAIPALSPAAARAPPPRVPCPPACRRRTPSCRRPSPTRPHGSRPRRPRSDIGRGTPPCGAARAWGTAR